MNKLLLVFVVTVAYVYAEGESSGSSEEDLKALATLVETKLNSTIINDLITLSDKTKKQCPDIEDKLDSTAEQVTECLDKIELGDETLCTLIINNLEKCSEPVTKLLTGCLPEESKALPALTVKIVKAIISEACNSTVEEILELFNPCVAEGDVKSYETCTSVKNTLTEYKNKIPSKSLVCSVLPKLKSCEKSLRDASCKNSVTKKAAVSFYEAVDAATAHDCQGANEV